MLCLKVKGLLDLGVGVIRHFKMALVFLMLKKINVLTSLKLTKVSEIVTMLQHLYQMLPTVTILEREPRTVFHVKRAKRFDPMEYVYLRCHQYPENVLLAGWGWGFHHKITL